MKNERAELFLDKKDKTEKRLSYYDELEKYFIEDPKSTINKLLYFPKYVPNNAVARFLARYEIFKLCVEIPGSVIECGVLGGAGVMTFAQISAILEPYNQTRKIIGFDTFEGFPGLSEHDQQGTSDYMQVSGYAENSFDSLKKCSAIHNEFRLLKRDEQVELIKGDIGVTAAQYVKEKPHLVVSLLYLDCDLYEPTKAALEVFLPRMPKGAIVAFDELNYEEYPGETIALAEVVGISNLHIRRLPYTKISYAIL